MRMLKSNVIFFSTAAVRPCENAQLTNQAYVKENETVKCALKRPPLWSAAPGFVSVLFH